jgi:hypothetical protein
MTEAATRIEIVCNFLVFLSELLSGSQKGGKLRGGVFLFYSIPSSSPQTIFSSLFVAHQPGTNRK